MKKKLFLGMLAAAAVTFTSCQKDEVLNSVPQDQPIEFGTYVGRGAQTKLNTSIDDKVDLAGKSFGVYAYYTKTADFNATTSTPNFMNNQKITSTDGTSWTYAPVKYWPNNPGEKVSFFAYAPYEEGSNTYDAVELQNPTTPGTPTVTYIVNTDCDKHVDLLYSNTDNTNKTKQSITGKINFNFAHALTRIGFKAQLFIDKESDDNTGSNDTNDYGKDLGAETKVEIKSIELIGNFNGKAKLKLSDGTWTNNENTISSFTIPADKLHNTTLNNKDKVSLNSNGITSEDKGYLMVIPKYFDGSSEEEALKIKVTYNVITTDENLSGGESKIENIIESKPFSIKFEQGKAYNFNLQLGLTSVKFSADVAEWDEADIAVNVPINFN